MSSFNFSVLAHPKSTFSPPRPRAGPLWHFFNTATGCPKTLSPRPGPSRSQNFAAGQGLPPPASGQASEGQSRERRPGFQPHQGRALTQRAEMWRCA